MPIRSRWREFVCAEGNAWVRIGEETYFVGAAGRLMPMLKGQQPPDLLYFRTSFRSLCRGVLAQKCIWYGTRVVADRGRRFSSAAWQIGRQLAT
jgi:hypothetical protein